MTYYYSVWIPQTLIFDVGKVINEYSNKFEKPKHDVPLKKGEVVMLLLLSLLFIRILYKYCFTVETEFD